MTDNIISLFSKRMPEEIPEVDLTLPTVDYEAPSLPVAPAIDLSGKPKAIMVFGPGRTGKTMILRWMIEERRGPTALVTLDAKNPTLWRYFPDMTNVPTSAAGAPRLLENVLKLLLKDPVTTAIDFSADMTLGDLLMVPDLVATMQAAGIEPVAIYMLTPRPDDLMVLNAMESGGFRPPATALVLNISTIPVNSDIEAEFAPVLRHHFFKDAVKRGAVVLEMPRLFAAREVDERRPLLFRDAVSSPMLDAWEQTRVRQWLQEMQMAFSPIRSWLP